MNESILLELQKIRDHALKLEDEIWSIGDTERETANKRIQEIIFQATEAIKKWEDSSGKEMRITDNIFYYDYCEECKKLVRGIPVGEGEEYIYTECPECGEITEQIDVSELMKGSQSVPPYKGEETDAIAFAKWLRCNAIVSTDFLYYVYKGQNHYTEKELYKIWKHE